MGGELCISNPAESGSHSWKCILVSNTSDSAITKLGYCGRRERFSTDQEVYAVFWKLWHSKKEYLDLPDGWSEEQQKFDMVCKAMQGDWETGTTPFDLFDKYEESGEEEPEDMRDFSINYWRQIGNYDSNANDYLWNANELYIRRDMLKNYLKDLNSGVSEDIVDNHYWPEFTDVEKDSIYGLLQWWDSSLDAEEIDTWFSQYPPMINVVETRWIEDARPELFTTMPIPWNPDETYVAESSENMVGECGYCASMQGYTPENMLLIADHPDLSHDFCKSCNSHHPEYKPTDECEDFNPRNPDVYEGQTWFCQGCGSGTEFLIDANKWVADAETFASETCECGELEEGDGEMYECSCCDGAFCVDCIENGDISAAIGGYRPAFLDNPRITETDTAYMDPQGTVCGECMTNIENELGDLTPIPELMEDEQGTANLASESKELKRTSCCCGATESSPCACMYEGVMNCSSTAPMCPCYKALAEKKADFFLVGLGLGAVVAVAIAIIKR